MANPEHLKILKQGVEVWNRWRAENPEVRPDLSDVDLCEMRLYKANLRDTNLYASDLANVYLFAADLTNANLEIVRLRGADLRGAHLDNAILTDTDLEEADLSLAFIRKATLIRTDLSRARLIETDISFSTLDGVRVYGISAWAVKKIGTTQRNLIITECHTPKITVDDLEVAQFIYLMLNNQKIRDVIETITSKAVLILGRFTLERKAVLDAIKDELRLRNYLPIVFDFENVSNKSIDETLNLLARMSRFVIADITDAKSIPQELRGFVPDNPSIPIVPLIWKAQHEYGMFDYFRNYPWVLPLHEYESPEQLMKNIIDTIIAPVEQKVLELKHK